MIFDAQNTFASKTALDTGAPAVGKIFGEVIDLWGGQSAMGVAPASVNGIVGGTFPFDPGRGVDLEIYVQVTTTVATTGDGGSVDIQLRNSTLAALTGGTTNTLASTGVTAINAATVWPAGKVLLKLTISLPPSTTLRYLGLWQAITTQAVTAGALTAGFVCDYQSNHLNNAYV